MAMEVRDQPREELDHLSLRYLSKLPGKIFSAYSERSDPQHSWISSRPFGLWCCRVLPYTFCFPSRSPKSSSLHGLTLTLNSLVSIMMGIARSGVRIACGILVLVQEATLPHSQSQRQRESQYKCSVTLKYFEYVKLC